MGQAGARPHPQRDGPDSDRARGGRRRCASECSCGTAPRLLHRRVPRGDDLGWSSAPGTQRRRSPCSGGSGGSPRVRGGRGDPGVRALPKTSARQRFASSIRPRARLIHPRARPGSRSGFWTSFAHSLLLSTPAETPPRRWKSTSASSPSARRVPLSAAPKRPTESESELRAAPLRCCPHAPVAQLDRASVYETEGHRFESCRARSRPGLPGACRSQRPESGARATVQLGVIRAGWRSSLAPIDVKLE